MTGGRPRPSSPPARAAPPSSTSATSVPRSASGTARRGRRSSRGSSTTRCGRCTPPTGSSPTSCGPVATRSTTSTGGPRTSRWTIRTSCSTTARPGTVRDATENGDGGHRAAAPRRDLLPLAGRGTARMSTTHIFCRRHQHRRATDDLVQQPIDRHDAEDDSRRADTDGRGRGRGTLDELSAARARAADDARPRRPAMHATSSCSPSQPTPNRPTPSRPTPPAHADRGRPPSADHTRRRRPWRQPIPRTAAYRTCPRRAGSRRRAHRSGPPTGTGCGAGEPRRAAANPCPDRAGGPTAPSSPSASAPSSRRRCAGRHHVAGQDSDTERLVPRDRADEYGSRWDAVKGNFVDEPGGGGRGGRAGGRAARRHGAALPGTAQRLEHGLDAEETSTEDLRVALRRYRRPAAVDHHAARPRYRDRERCCAHSRRSEGQPSPAPGSGATDRSCP